MHVNTTSKAKASTSHSPLTPPSLVPSSAPPPSPLFPFYLPHPPPLLPSVRTRARNIAPPTISLFLNFAHTLRPLFLPRARAHEPSGVGVRSDHTWVTAFVGAAKCSSTFSGMSSWMDERITSTGSAARTSDLGPRPCTRATTQIVRPSTPCLGLLHD